MWIHDPSSWKCTQWIVHTSPTMIVFPMVFALSKFKVILHMDPSRINAQSWIWTKSNFQGHTWAMRVGLPCHLLVLLMSELSSAYQFSKQWILHHMYKEHSNVIKSRVFDSICIRWHMYINNFLLFCISRVLRGVHIAGKATFLVSRCCLGIAIS